MAVEVKIPAVGESISSGVVSVWHKNSGDFVNSGDALFTLETDKVSTEIAAETSGVLDTLVPAGQEVKIGEVVATIDESKKAPAAAPAENKSAEARQPAAPKTESSGAETLSPAVRRIVDEQALDPAQIHGTGPGGRITKADALTAAQTKTAGQPAGIKEKQQTVPPSQERRSDDGRVVRKKMSPLRRSAQNCSGGQWTNRRRRYRPEQFL